jgi:hypothetical protein
MKSFSMVVLMAACGLLQAQSPSSGGWRRFGDPPPASAPAPAAAQAPVPAPVPEPQDPSEPVDRSAGAVQAQPGQPQPDLSQPYQPDPSQAPPANRPAYGLPPQVVLQPGTYVTVRIDQPLSSDRNQPGDPFSASLAQPLVVDGIVVAQAGQRIYGRVAEAVRHHSDRPSRLGLELTTLTLVDGTQVPVRSQLVSRQGPTTPGSVQAGTVAGTTAVGAAIGAAADWGTGALVGGGIGAAAGIIGVMMTRNHPTVVYPESELTFRMETPLTISTARAPQAFRYVGPEDYSRPSEPRLVRRGPPAPAYPYPAPMPYYYGPYYPYPYWGPGIGVYWGSGYWGRGRHRW